MVEDLKTLYDYSYWANKKLFDVMSRLTHEQFTQSVAGSYGSIRNTLVHAMSAEAGWLERCGGPERGPKLNPADFPTLESVIQKWKQVEAHVREFFANLKDEDLDRDAEFMDPAGNTRVMSVGELMQHAVIHGIHHRGQVVLLLRMLGQEPGNIDMLIYDAVKRGVSVR